jgi:predicted hotdog family 3-hydroxylacyl-ACP dehydratase
MSARARRQADPSSSPAFTEDGKMPATFLLKLQGVLSSHRPSG